MIYGLDLLGGARFQETATRSFPRGFALGIFANTFGDSRPLVNALCKSKKAVAVRVHLLWKDKVGGMPTYSGKDFPNIEEIAKKWHRLLVRYPAVKWYISPVCEHSLKRADVQELYRRLSKIFVNVKWQYVNTPYEHHGASGFPFALEERHGKVSTPGDIYSSDGKSSVDLNIKKIEQDHVDRAELFFFWHARFNLKWSDDDTTPRPKRTAKPNHKLIRSIAELSRAKKQTNLMKEWLYKSHAERGNLADLKGDKALILAPIKTHSIDLFTMNDKLIHSIGYYGPFEGGGHRYYSNKLGLELAEAAYRVSGDYRVKVTAEKKQYGIIDPVFREGFFR